MLLAALRKPEVAKLESVQRVQQSGDAAAWLVRRVNVSFPNRAEIMEVSVTCNDPREAVILVRAVVDAYLAEVVNLERKAKQDRLAELNRVYGEKETEIRIKSEDLKKLTETLGVSDPETIRQERSLAYDDLNTRQQELAKIRSELRGLRQKLADQEAGLKSYEVTDGEVASLVSNDLVAQRLREELEHRMQDKEYTEVISLGKMDAHDAERYKKEFEKLQEQFNARRKALISNYANEGHDSLKVSIQNLEASVAVRAEHQKDLEKEFQNRHDEARRIGRTNVDVEMLQADIKNLDAVLGAITTERAKLGLELRAAPRVVLLQRADVPEKPD